MDPKVKETYDDVSGFFDAIEGALGVVTTVTSLPGVDLLTDLIPAAAAIKKVLGYAQFALSARQKLKPYADALVEAFADGLPSPEKLAALDVKIEAQHKRIQEFDPKAEEGEEE